MNNIIEIKNLSFKYDMNIEVLSDINEKFTNGRLIAILGKNGSGKSTFLDCLLNINEYNGEIILKGHNIKEYSPKEFSKIVTFIPQSTEINIDYQVEEFISFGRNPYLSLSGKLNENDYKIIEESAKKCDISYLLKKYINRISGGERQLAFIARSLAQETDIIIMDEPTASLDFGNQQKLFIILKELIDDGKTVIITTHNPNHLINIDCDIYAIKNKKIEKIKELNCDVLKEIYGLDFSISKKSFDFKLS